MTVAGGTLRTDATGRTLNNTFTFNGDETFGAFSGSNTLTITLSATTPAGSITVNGARTFTLDTSVSLSGTITNPSTTASLLIQGPGTLSLTNSSAIASTLGNLTIGNTTTPTGALGGTLVAISSVSPANVIGTGNDVVNYGGTLDLGGVSGGTFSNVLTVNAEGAFRYPNSAVTSSSVISVPNLSSVGSGSTAPQKIVAGAYTLPTAGVLGIIGSGVGLNGAFPALTGTLAFVGALTGNSSTVVGGTTLSTGPDTSRTIAFDNSGAGFNFTGGLTLNANLVVAGSGQASVAGSIPGGPAGFLGTVSQTGAAKSINVSMSPTGQFNLAPTTNGFTGGLTINSGTAAVDATASGFQLGGTAVTLNGGTFRNTDGGGVTTGTYSDNILVTPSGGTIEAFSTGGTLTKATFAGTISQNVAGSGQLVLRAGGLVGDPSFLVISGNASGLTAVGTLPPVVLATSNGRGTVLFASSSAVPSILNSVSAPSGVPFGFTTPALAASLINRFVLDPGGESILDVTNQATINLSNTGDANALNANVRLGFHGPTTATTQITPFGSMYRVAEIDGADLTVGNDLFTGPNGLDVSAAAQAPNSYGIAVSTGVLGRVFLGVTNDYTGPTTIEGTVLNALAGGGLNAAALGTSAATNFGFTSSLTVDKGGFFIGGASVSYVPTSVTGIMVTARGNGTIRFGSVTAATNNNIVNHLDPTDNLTFGGSDGGGNIIMALPAAGTHSQTFNGLSILAGNNAISTLNAVTAGALPPS